MLTVAQICISIDHLSLDPIVTPCWEEVLSVNGSGFQLPPQMANVQAESWTSMTLSTERQPAELSIWPHDMEGTENEFKVVLPLIPVCVWLGNVCYIYITTSPEEMMSISFM